MYVHMCTCMAVCTVCVITAIAVIKSMEFNICSSESSQPLAEKSSRVCKIPTKRGRKKRGKNDQILILNSKRRCRLVWNKK